MPRAASHHWGCLGVPVCVEVVAKDQWTVDRCDGQQIINDLWPMLDPISLLVLDESNTGEDHVDIIGDLFDGLKVFDIPFHNVDVWEMEGCKSSVGVYTGTIFQFRCIV